MFKLFKKLFYRKNNKEGESLIYNVVDIDVAQMSGHPNILEDVLYQRNGVDAVIIRNVLSRAEVRDILKDFNESMN
ncbi:MAG: hypothetical protein ACI9YU_001018 [Flavobacteriales bacterium]|jgi:hypothetical protein